MSKADNSEKELAAIWNAFAEVIAQSSDEEILAEAREEGRDPQETGKRVRSLLKNAVKAYQQTKLRAAEERYKQRVIKLSHAKPSLPKSPEERRALLSKILARVPEMRSALVTTQFREFESIPDADVESFLQQMMDLGVIDAALGSDEPR